MNAYASVSESIARTEDSYVLRDWLPKAKVDCFLGAISREVAQGFKFQHAAYVEATCDVKDPSSDRANDASEYEEASDEFDDPLRSAASFQIPQLALAPRARMMIKSLVVWNHVNSSALARMLGEIARCVDIRLDDMAAEMGERQARVRDTQSSCNYITVRHLVDRQRIDVRHMEPEDMDSCKSPVCLLALGGERTLYLWVWGMERGEPADEIPLTHGSLVVLTPSLLANGYSYAVRPPRKGRNRGGCVTHPQHALHVLLEIRGIENLCQVDASLMPVA